MPLSCIVISLEHLLVTLLRHVWSTIIHRHPHRPDNAAKTGSLHGTGKVQDPVCQRPELLFRGAASGEECKLCMWV